MADTTTLTYHGHSAFQVDSGRYKILIDPFITNNPSAKVKAEDLNPTHIILSHGHDDHFGDTLAIARRTGAMIICMFEIAEYCEKLGLNAWGMSVGGGYDFEFGRVKFTLAHHSSSLPDGTYAGDPVGILLTIGEQTIYHAGDTALFLDMKLIGDRNEIDVALLPIGDNFTMGIEDAATAVEFLKPRLAIPMHYNTFPPITADPEQFKSRVETLGYAARVLHPGEKYEMQ